MTSVASKFQYSVSVWCHYKRTRCFDRLLC